MDEIFKRRSIRKYRSEPLTDQQLDLLLKAGMSAPTARNTRPWEFLVVTDRDILTKISAVHPYAKMLLTAPCAIIVCARPQKQPGTTDIYFQQDCAAATENILLQACSMGLGSVWCGVYPKADRVTGITDIFGLPDDIIPFNVIALGYPDEEPAYREKYDPNIIHFNKW